MAEIDVSKLPDDMKARARLDETGRYIQGLQDGLKLNPGGGDKKIMKLLLHLDGTLELLKDHLMKKTGGEI